jgi:phenylacetate-CoA ligase
VVDLLNGTRVGRVLHFLERSQWWPEERLVALQRRKLGAVLSWTASRSAFYRDFWNTAPDERRAASLYPELDNLPVVTKADLRERLYDFPVPGFRGRVLKIQTSGSTGEPMTFLRSAEQDSWFWALRFRMWQWGGYVLGEPYLTLNLNPRTALRKRLQDLLFRCSYHGFNANSHDVDAVLSDFSKKGVKHLVGYASSLYLLSEAIRLRGISGPRVQSVISTGDTLFPAYRRRIEESFGARVVDYYGAGGEGFHLASQCEERRSYHVHVENSVVEILRDGRPARPGEMGEVVVTQLDNQAMPLIRYGTQDLAVPAERGTCACGRQLPLLESVQGRVPDIVFAILFEHLEGIQQFQVRQQVSDRIRIEIVRDSSYRTATEARIRDAVVRATHGSLGVEFQYVQNIPLSRSGKRRFVVSEIVKGPFSVSSMPGDGSVSAIRRCGQA